MLDGINPKRGGWNRFEIEVADLAGIVDALRKLFQPNPDVVPG